MKQILSGGMFEVPQSGNNCIHGSIIIEDGYIVDIIPNHTYSGENVLNIEGKFVTPALINCHHHSSERFLIGSYTQSCLLDLNRNESLKRLYQYIGRDEQYLYSSMRLELAEQALQGVGSICVIPHKSFGTKAIDAAYNSGLRCWLVEDCEMTQNYFSRQIKYAQSRSVRLALWLHSEAKTPDASNLTHGHLNRITKLKKAYPFLITMHAYETKWRMEYFSREYHDQSLSELLEEYKLLDQNLILVHCLYADDKSLSLLKEKNVKIVICPSSELNLGSGLPNLKGLLQLNYSWGLGTDGGHYNHGRSLLQECELGFLLLRGTTDIMESVSSTINRITENGAHILKEVSRNGRLEIGEKADIAIWNVDGGYDIQEQKTSIHITNILTGRSTGYKADYLFVNGECIVARKNYMPYSYAQLKSEYYKSVESLLIEVGKE